MNIRKNFRNKLENMGFKGHPLFKLFVEPSKKLDIPSRHYDKYWIIVNILHKCLIGFDNFEVLIERNVCRSMPLLIVNKDSTFIVS